MTKVSRNNSPSTRLSGYSQTIRVGFISLGCAKNLVDTEHIAACLRRDGIELAASPEVAEAIVINTCGFIGPAKKESLDAIRKACARKAAGLCRWVLVGGCLAQREGAKLARALPEVSAFFGLDQLDQVGSLIGRLAAGGDQLNAIGGRVVRTFEPRPDRPVFTGGPFGYVKIAEGCNHRCGFCAIPLFRGRYRSRTIASIVRESERLLERGVRELNLIAQDVTAYGSDRGRAVDLCAVLKALGRLGGGCWIRLLYAYPTGIDLRLLETMGEVPQVCRYLDVPIQHSHPDILRAMGRATTIRPVADLCERIRRQLPDVTLRTTCLVGYPGETPAHFRHLRDYLALADFDHLGVFTFFCEEGTPAARMTRQTVSSRLASDRRRILLRAQQQRVLNKARLQIGQVTPLMLEKPAEKPGCWIARGPNQAPEVDGLTWVDRIPRTAKAGDFCDAHWTGFEGYDRIARMFLNKRFTRA